MDLILLTRLLLGLSIPGFLFCLYRSIRAGIKGDIRALSKVYSKHDELVEFRVWFWSHLLLTLVFLAIIVLILTEQNNVGSANETTRFHTRLILLVQFCALIPLVPLLMRMLLSKKSRQATTSDSTLLDQARQCATLSEALSLLDTDYRIESRDTSGDITSITLSLKDNSSELLWIEARCEDILEIR